MIYYILKYHIGIFNITNTRCLYIYIYIYSVFVLFMIFILCLFYTNMCTWVLGQLIYYCLLYLYHDITCCLLI